MTLPDKLTAAEFERLKAQEQRMLNSGSWVPQAENTWAAEMNAKAAEDAAPATMTAEQADAALSQQSVAAETSFGRSMGARPDYSSGPAVNPADSEPKTIEELRRKQQELYHDPSYEMPFDEWKDFTQWQRETEGEVSGFLRGLSGAPAMLGQLGVGIVQERAQQYMRAMGGDPIGAATAEVATFKEMGRKIGVGLTQLTDWAGGKINDMVASGRRAGQVQANIVQALRDSGKLTGDPVQDNTIIQQAMEEAAAQGMFEPTQQQAEEDDETGYQRYLRNQAYTREYMGVTQYSIGGSPVTLPDVKKTATNPLTGQVEQPMESTATVAAMVASPENFIPIGVGAMARVRMLRRFASLTGKAFKGGEEAAAALDGMMMRGADRLTSRLPLIGDLSLNKRMAALGGVGAAAAYLDTQIDSPVVDVIAKPLIVAGAFLPSVKAAGATLRKVGSASGATWQVIKEMDAGAMGSVRAETAARMADSGKFNPRYARYMRAGAEGGVESTLRRVSQNADMPETLRRVARSADNIGITQLARGVDDVVSSAAVTGLVATPFALMAPDSETAGGIFGGAVLLGGTTGAAARVIGRRSARTDADIARMMVDVEMAGGDAGSLGALSYSGLDMLSAMQGITSGKVDFIPLRAQEYRANADVKANGGETTAGLHIEQAADGRAKVYVNMGHTAPVAGRVSIRSLENGNVVRIKGRNGESDFTFVPKEYPLLVKSGDFVEPNAHLARGLSPTRVMPHEIGHAILTSNILSGTVRDDLRNIVNQRYDTPGVELRGREYVTRLVDKDIMAGAHDQLPDKLTQQEFDDIASGKRTLADVLKGKPVSEAQRTQMINDRYQEMRERSIAQGDNPDGLDVFRDEIVAETFSSLSEGIDFRRMRTGGPQVMESMLAATTRVFETLGMAFNPSTGKPLDNPSVIFRDNPLMQDPVMRKRMQEHLRNYEAWMLGMEQAGAREQRGTQISVDGTAESARRSTHTKLRANENGILENDLIYIDQNGTAQWKSQGVLDQQERGRSAQVGQLYDKNKIVAPNSAEFGLRRTGGGRTIISGPTLPAKFDVLRWFPKHVREMARMLEASRDRGASHTFDYNTIGTGEGGRYRVINRGDVQAILREGAFLGWEATKAGHLKAVIMDLNAFRAAAMKAINKGELGVFNNDMAQVHADLLVYLSNHKNGLPGEATIGQQKRDMLNGLIGTGTAVQRDINPLYTDLNPRGSVRTFRIDRVNDITPTGRDGYHFDYDKIKNNRMPQQIPREAQGMPDAPASGRGDGMPDSQQRVISYHLTDDPNFSLDKNRKPQNNTTLGGDWPNAGIFVGDSAERWFNGYNYVRPFVVELSHPPVESMGSRAMAGGGYGGEKFIPAEAFDSVEVRRVIPYDEYARETFGEFGPIEEYFNLDSQGNRLPEPVAEAGTLFSQRPKDSLRNYRYSGKDVREMSPAQRRALIKRTQDYARATRPEMFADQPAAARRGQAMPDYSGRADIPLNERARRAAFVSDDGRVVTTGKRTHFETNEDLGPDFLAIGAGSIGEDGFFRFGSETMDDAMGETPSQSMAAAARHNQAVYDSGRRPSKLLEDPPGLERMAAEGKAMPDRRALQQRAKELGLPANWTTKEIGELVRIAEKNPYEWTREEFNTLAPHLSIHQDLRPGSNERVKQIMERGLPSGMVDSVGNWVEGRHTWAFGEMAGDNAYLFISGGLKYRPGSSNPWLAEGNMPIAHIKTKPGQKDIYEALVATRPQNAQSAAPRGQAMPDTGPQDGPPRMPRPPRYAKNAPIKAGGGTFINQQVVKSPSSVPKNILETNPSAFFDRIGNAAQKIIDDPARMADPNGYLEYMRDAGVWGDVLYAPPTLKVMIESPQAYVDNLLGGYHGDRTKPGTMEAADAGLDATVRMREAIGERPPQMVTALHHLWGILSRMLPPVEQESAWLRLISRPKILEQIQRSIDGQYRLESGDWKKLVQQELRATNSFAKGRGNQGTANANAFHGMLSKWNGQWDRVSDVYSAPNSIEAGRRFWSLGLGSVGIRNKVQRFIGLTYGIPGLIMDRWKFVEFYYPQFGKKPQEYFSYSATGTPEDPMGIYGQYGAIEGDRPFFSLAFYEGMEIALQRAIDNSPELQQVLGRHANVGGMHWKGWNAIKNEAVGHSSLDLTYDLVRANPNPTPETLLQLLKSKEYYTEGLVGNSIQRFTLPIQK